MTPKSDMQRYSVAYYVIASVWLAAAGTVIEISGDIPWRLALIGGFFLIVGLFQQGKEDRGQ